jgi:hypothetical protein
MKENYAGPDIEAIQDRANAAKAGPWVAQAGREAWSVTTGQGSLSWDDHAGEVFTQLDASFIAHAHEDIPALLEALAAARANQASDTLIEQAVQVERDRQVAIGYDEEHDDGHGPEHLAYWAQEYRKKGQFIKALALWRAYDETIRRQAAASNARMQGFPGRGVQPAAPAAAIRESK